MHPRLKNVTERAQKYDFSVNFHILIEQTGFRSDILCQKVDIKRHCVFPLNIALKETLNCLEQVQGPTFCVRKLTLNVIVFFHLT